MFTLLGIKRIINAKHLDSVFELVCLNWEIRTTGLRHLDVRRIELDLLSFRCLSDDLVRCIWQVTQGFKASASSCPLISQEKHGAFDWADRRRVRILNPAAFQHVPILPRRYFMGKTTLVATRV